VELLLTWVGVFALLGFVASGVSLWLHRKPGSLSDVSTRVHALELDLNELYDRVDHWQRRDRVRRLRQGQEELPIVPQDVEPARGTPEHKAWLRGKLLQIRGAK